MRGAICFPNSRITVKRIALLLKLGENPLTILEDYSNLKPIDLKFSRKYVKL